MLLKKNSSKICKHTKNACFFDCSYQKNVFIQPIKFSIVCIWLGILCFPLINRTFFFFLLLGFTCFRAFVCCSLEWWIYFSALIFLTSKRQMNNEMLFLTFAYFLCKGKLNCRLQINTYLLIYLYIIVSGISKKMYIYIKINKKLKFILIKIILNVFYPQSIHLFKMF